ncbi:MAG: zinc-binding dehydrogenase [Planctomycetota bacterium]|jgi:NADPH:quinone reductase-like Zn-dependent oxidoreductase
MRAAVIVRQGAPVAPNVEVVDDWPGPTAGSGEVVVRTEATALNHLDLHVGRGVPGLDLTYPRVTGADGCGRVDSVGKDVDPSWIGRRVLLNAALPQTPVTRPEADPTPGEIRMIGEHDPGTLAEKFVAPVENVLAIGDSDPVDAAAFALTHLTAWRMLMTRAGLRAGQTVLITGIGGGVALALLNISKHFGCTTIVTSRHRWKLDKALQHGADHAIQDRGEDWSREVRGLTDKRGADICADSIGKAVHESCLRSLARGGVLVTCGCTSGADAGTDLTRMFWNQLSMVGSTMGDMSEFRQVVSLLRSGALKPVIDTVHDAAGASEAYARLESGEQFGKVVIRWG